MAFQLIYTSASAALKPGVTGFATVAQHRGIRAAVVRAIEQRSSYLDSAAHGGKRPAVFAFRRIEAAGERAYVLTRVVASGADYTGRNNHLAHHLVVAEAELVNLRLSPADVMLQMKWEDRWDKEPQYFTEAEEIKLATMTPSLALPASKWPSWSKSKGGSWDPACAAIPFNSNESKDARSFFAVGEVSDTGRLLELYGESLLLKDPDRTRPALMWQTPFTTLEIQAEDAQEFQWIGCVHGSPRHHELLKQKRSIIDLTAPTLQPPTGELAEIARNPARAARKPDAATKPTDTATKAATQPDAPIVTAAENKVRHRDKKRDFEKEMLAHIEGADVEEKGLRERLLPVIIGVTVLFLALVGWVVYQDLDTKSKNKAARIRREALTSQVTTLKHSFAQGTDVSLPARNLSDHDDFKALPENDTLRTQLDQLIQQHQVWQELRTQIAALSQQQLALKPADDAMLTAIRQRLANQSLPLGIHQELAKEVELLLAEQQGMRQIFAVRDKGVDEQRRGEEKLRLEAIANSMGRTEVRTGMQKVVEQLFPKAVVVENKPPPPPMVADKPKEVTRPKTTETATDSNPSIALLQRLPPTHVVPRTELHLPFAAVEELKRAMGTMTADDASGSPSVSVAEAGTGLEPKEAGVLNVLDGQTSFTTYRIAGTNVYDANNKNVMEFKPSALALNASALNLSGDRPLWKPESRYLFAFSMSKPEAAGLPPPRTPDLHLLSMPPAASKEDALKMPPLLRLPAADFLMRDGSRIVIKTGGAPDPRKLLGKLLLAAGTASGTSFAYEITADAAPLLKRSNGPLDSKGKLLINGSLPAFVSSGTADDATLWSKVGIDLSAEIQRPSKTQHDENQKVLSEWSPRAAGLEALSPSIPTDFTKLAQNLVKFRQGNKKKGEPEWVRIPLNPQDDLPVRYPPSLILGHPAGRSAITTYLDMLSRTITMLKNAKHIHLTAEDENLKLVLEQYMPTTAWINKDAWTTVVAAYTALLAGRPATEIEREMTQTKPPFFGQQRWSNRDALLQWFNGMLSPEMMAKAQDYLTWVPGTEGLDPIKIRLEAETALQVWHHNDRVAELLEKGQPEKLSASYTVMVNFPFTFSGAPPQSNKGYLKWVEFTGQPEAAPALPPTAPAPPKP